MLLAVLLLIAGELGALLFGCLVLVWRVNRKYQTLRAAVISELAALTKGEPCHTATVINAIGEHIGATAGRSAKAALMADLAHVSRAQNQASVEQQIALADQQGPGLGALVRTLGKGKSGTRMWNNPLVQLALGALQKGGASNESEGPGNGSSVRGRLERMG